MAIFAFALPSNEALPEAAPEMEIVRAVASFTALATDNVPAMNESILSFSQAVRLASC
ncbi:hypothetical protein D9M68_669820 [compost metagenome]